MLEKKDLRIHNYEIYFSILDLSLPLEAEAMDSRFFLGISDSPSSSNGVVLGVPSEINHGGRKPNWTWNRYQRS